MDSYSLHAGITQANQLTGQELSDNYSIDRANKQVKSDLSDKLSKLDEVGDIRDIRDAGLLGISGVQIGSAVKRYNQGVLRAKQLKARTATAKSLVDEGMVKTKDGFVRAQPKTGGFLDSVKSRPTQGLSKPIASEGDEEEDEPLFKSQETPPPPSEPVARTPPTSARPITKPATEDTTTTASVAGEGSEDGLQKVDKTLVQKGGEAMGLGEKAAGVVEKGAGVLGSLGVLSEGLEGQYSSFKNPNHHGLLQDLSGDNAAEKAGNVSSEIGSVMDIVGAVSGQPELALIGSGISAIGGLVSDVGDWFHHKDDAKKITATATAAKQTPEAINPLADTGGIAETSQSTLRSNSSGY